MHKINLKEWDILYTEFINWVNERNASVYAIADMSQGKNAIYAFKYEEDLVAFTLKFTKSIFPWANQVGIDTGNYPLMPDYEKTDSNK